MYIIEQYIDCQLEVVSTDIENKYFVEAGQQNKEIIIFVESGQ
jgi:hypothetical protein